MEFKNYFNNLEKYWSANFLALISSTFLLTFIIWILVNLVGLAFQAESFSKYIETVDKIYPLYSPIYLIIFFPASCYLSVRIFIFYIFIIISRKNWHIIASLLPIIIFFVKFFIETKDIMLGTGFGTMVFFYLLPITIIGIIISIGIYLILLLLELIPKFRVPQALVSQNIIFKKYVSFFYWLYLIIVCAIICTIFNLLFI